MIMAQLFAACFVLVTMGYVTSQDACDNRAILSRLNSMERQLETLQEKMETLEKKDYSDTFFVATVTDYATATRDADRIIFDRVLSNPGSHYNPLLGSYTVPYDGYYQFSVTKTGNNKQPSFFLLVDEEKLWFYEFVASADSAPSGSATVNLELKKDQIIRVQNRASTVVYGVHDGGWVYTWFTGFLIFPL